MDGFAVGERHHPQDPASELRNRGPEADSSIGLDLACERLSKHPLAPLAPKVGAFPEDLFLEVARRLHQLVAMVSATSWRSDGSCSRPASSGRATWSRRAMAAWKISIPRPFSVGRADQRAWRSVIVSGGA